MTHTYRTTNSLNQLRGACAKMLALQKKLCKKGKDYSDEKVRVVLYGDGQTSHGLLLQKKKDLEESLLVFASGIFCFKARNHFQFSVNFSVWQKKCFIAF